MNSFEIALKSKQLPDKIEELVPMMFAGQAAVKFMAAKLKLVSDKNLSDPLGKLDKQRKSTVEDGQAMGEMLLQIMGRIGELSEKVENAKGEFSSSGPGTITATKTKDKYKHEKVGLKSKNQLKQAQFIKNHPDLVKETIADCKKNDDIPNITTVLQKHKIKKMMEKHPVKDRKLPDVNVIVFDAYNKLGDVYAKLTQAYKYPDSITEKNKEQIEEIVTLIYNIVKR